jgi:hypothetical protein
VSSVQALESLRQSVWSSTTLKDLCRNVILSHRGANAGMSDKEAQEAPQDVLEFMNRGYSLSGDLWSHLTHALSLI